MSSSYGAQDGPWKSQVREHFEQIEVSEIQSAALESLLFKAPVKTNFYRAPLVLFNRMKLGYVFTAALSAALTFLVIGTPDDSIDPITELASQPGPRTFPADFDLEGDPTGFREIMKDAVSPGSFQADLPSELKGQYIPGVGRIFSWSGGTGVSIQLHASHTDFNGLAPSGSTTLYIVQLSGKTDLQFPQGKTTKRVKNAGKLKKVNAWREGKYGYAVVQSVAVTD